MSEANIFRRLELFVTKIKYFFVRLNLLKFYCIYLVDGINQDTAHDLQSNDVWCQILPDFNVRWFYISNSTVGDLYVH